MLVHSERLSGDGRLINLKERVLGNYATVGGNNGTLLNLEDITRNDLRSFNFLEGSITENNSLESKSLLQFVDNGASLEFLDKTDGSVEQQKSANDTDCKDELARGPPTIYTVDKGD